MFADYSRVRSEETGPGTQFDGLLYRVRSHEIQVRAEEINDVPQNGQKRAKKKKLYERSGRRQRMKRDEKTKKKGRGKVEKNDLILGICTSSKLFFLLRATHLSLFCPSHTHTYSHSLSYYASLSQPFSSASHISSLALRFIYFYKPNTAPLIKYLQNSCNRVHTFHKRNRTQQSFASHCVYIFHMLRLVGTRSTLNSANLFLFLHIWWCPCSPNFCTQFEHD